VVRRLSLTVVRLGVALWLALAAGCPGFGAFGVGNGDGDAPQPDLETCTNLPFQENITVDDREAVMDDLFACFGDKATGGAAYDVAFDEQGDVTCVGTFAESIVPADEVDDVVACQRAVLETITADVCEDCGVRAVGFLFCLNAPGDDACTPFLDETVEAGERNRL